MKHLRIQLHLYYTYKPYHPPHHFIPSCSDECTQNAYF
uniref:Uncharacterized protein n=1 Tax=Anguilla anguilla TaxID=7936 RepID=A0A0E9W9P6_ANGAN